jgi:protein-disulfide isomerase
MKPRQKTESKSVISPVMIGGVIAAAILVVAGLILLGNQSQVGGSVDTSQFPTMGDPDAPVTITEFSDYG